VTGEWHGGKGSKRRNANDKAYSDNWDKIFGSKKDDKDKPQEPQSTRTKKQQKDI
jgi:hypothetical protein